MTIHPAPKPPVTEKKPRKRLVAKKRLQAKTPIKKRNKERLDRRTKQYKVYMSSATWKGRRLAALIAADWKCQRCGEAAMVTSNVARVGAVIEHLTEVYFHVHHKTYARFGKELPEDLEVLCESCHNAEHASRAIKPRFLRAG